MLVALMATSLRRSYGWRLSNMTTVRTLLQRMETSNSPWTEVVNAVFDHAYVKQNHRHTELRRQAEFNLTNVTRRKKLTTQESIWVLRTLSEHRTRPWRISREPFLIGICLAILSNHVLRKDGYFLPLLKEVVTLAAMSCPPQDWNRDYPITLSRKHSWLLQNVRNPALFTHWFEDTTSDHHEQLLSLLFLVIHVLLCRTSYSLAAQYLAVITARDDLPLYASALTAIAPAIGSNTTFSAIIRALVVPQTRDLILIMHDTALYGERFVREELLESYDLRLGASENPDPNILAIVFMLHEYEFSDTNKNLENVHQELKNPWLRLAARVVARLDIPDGPCLPMGSSGDHRVYNMIAARSLLRYTNGTVTQYTELLLLESFLESREPSISSVALEYYMRTAMSYPGSPPPSYYLSTAVSAAFKFILPDHPLWMGWTILDVYVDGFETLSVEWRRSFAVGFFTLSRRPLLKPRGDTGSMTQESEIERILTWEYFDEEEQEREWPDSEFSGLDWMAMAWSLHLSQQSGIKTEGSEHGKAKSRNLSGPPVHEEFVLRALCKLLDAAPPHQLIPIIPKLYGFVQWFGDIELSEYRRKVSTRIKEVAHMHEEFQRLHCFHKFHCTWYI
jgi:hypothetical protein